MNSEEARRSISQIDWPQTENAAAFQELMRSLCSAESPYGMLQSAESAEWVANRARHFVEQGQNGSINVAHVYSVGRVNVCVVMGFTLNDDGMRTHLEIFQMFESVWSNEKMAEDHEEQYRSVKSMFGRLDKLGWRRESNEQDA